MRYEFTAIPDAEVPVGVEPAFRHAVATYASETNKTASVWRAVPHDRLDFKPHGRGDTVPPPPPPPLPSGRRGFFPVVARARPPAGGWVAPRRGRPQRG